MKYLMVITLWRFILTRFKYKLNKFALEATKPSSVAGPFIFCMILSNSSAW